MATAKGHMDQKRQNSNSTKAHPSPTPDDLFPNCKPPTANTHFAKIMALDPNHINHSDLTGRFPTQSLHGDNCPLVMCHCDSNLIWAEPMKNRSDTEALRAHKVLFDSLIKTGAKPHFHRMDNEASKAVKHHISNLGIKYQLTPAANHRQNAAERAT